MKKSISRIYYAENDPRSVAAMLRGKGDGREKALERRAQKKQGWVMDQLDRITVGDLLFHGSELAMALFLVAIVIR